LVVRYCAGVFSRSWLVIQRRHFLSKKVTLVTVDESTAFKMPVRVEITPPPPANSKQPGVTKSLLYNGSKFQGFQKSKGNSYEVEVVLQHVDEENSYLCGYLQINGLTEEYPTLTTFFDGEIISQKYPFLTRKWDADEDVDKKHWVRQFTALSIFLTVVRFSRANFRRFLNTRRHSTQTTSITRLSQTRITCS
jgi:hypothetical protein